MGLKKLENSNYLFIREEITKEGEELVRRLPVGSKEEIERSLPEYHFIFSFLQSMKYKYPYNDTALEDMVPNILDLTGYNNQEDVIQLISDTVREYTFSLDYYHHQFLDMHFYIDGTFYKLEYWGTTQNAFEVYMDYLNQN